MSFQRLIYYSAFIAGWAALLGWLVAEVLFHGSGFSGRLPIVVTGGLVGCLIGLGLNVVAGMTNAQWKQLSQRAVPGLIVGGIGGVLGSLLGGVLYDAGLPRAIGWMFMGMGIGVADGLYDRAKSKIRNGLIGGALGGLLGGFLFEPLQSYLQTESGMSGRATGFVLLGIAIGVSIGLIQVVLKEAWLTVVDGYRAGRQLILTQPVTFLGRADHLQLPFLGSSNMEVEGLHVKITRAQDGSFWIEDNNTRAGTLVNSKRLQSPAPLNDGDLVRFGTNIVRFNHRHRKAEVAGAIEVAPAPLAPGAIRAPMAPPPAAPGRAPGGPATPAPRPMPTTPAPLPIPPLGQEPAVRPAPSAPAPAPARPAAPAPPAGGRPGGMLPPPPPPPPKR